MYNNNFKINFGIRKINKNCDAIIGNNHAFFIQGGGTRGIFAFGVLKYLFEQNPYFLLSDVSIFGGTSVGSYLATVLSLGYDKDDIMAISRVLNMSILIDNKFMLPISIIRLLICGHLYSDYGRIAIANKILEYRFDSIKVDLQIPQESQFKPTDLTFGCLRKLIEYNPNKYKHLIINTVDVNREEQIFMTTLEEKWYNIKIFDALLASSAIPFVFEPIKLYYYPKTNMYGYKHIPDSTLNILVDGGVSTDTPLDFFLLDFNKYANYKMWLLKFTGSPSYVKIDGIISLTKQLIHYLITGKNSVKMDIVEKKYCINTINLYSEEGTLKIYTPNDTQHIIENVYNECINGEIYFGN